MPLLMVCLEGLGKLAQKYPNIASTSITALSNFLLLPSPVLLKLHKQQGSAPPISGMAPLKRTVGSLALTGKPRYRGHSLGL
ncbi:unnamed protein product [Cyprideis torosa]|uniref:Uncharacterized protein n=1 Tax=Cyprideis torosa TaxID=163714 RepID=A0A7R8WVV7_9CRUS|nr:unnamed protein product [Cyprideis torosa]CAG0911252.1 unnamed protein product [Cyprideis torosa]